MARWSGTVFEATRTPAPSAAAIVLPRLHAGRDGRLVLLRELRATDLALLGEFIDALSATARRQRFHGAVKVLPRSLLQGMSQADPHHELVLLAISVDSGRCIGEARYMLGDDAPAAREFALVVADAWQGAGLGQAMLCTLQAHARQRGVERLVGDLMRENLAMIGLAQNNRYALRRHPGDPRLLRATLELSRAQDLVSLPCAARSGLASAA